MPITISSVDIAGRREMREFFNGIVRLQVSAANPSDMIFWVVCDTYDNSLLVLSYFELWFY